MPLTPSTFSSHYNLHLGTILSFFPFPFCSRLENMDQVKSQNVEALIQSIKAQQYLIKLTQLLVSVSLCSFLFSPSSLLAFLHYFNFYFSTFPFQLFTHTIDKNCMFLLCNGLLVFVGITRSFSSSNVDDEPSKYIEDDSKSQFSDVEASKPILEKEAEEKIGDPDEQNNDPEVAIETKYSDKVQEEIEMASEKIDEQEKESSQSAVEEGEKEPDEDAGVLDDEVDDFLVEEKLEEVEIVEEEEEEEEEEEGNWVLSTEELNKKFDDFIRRMREDLRVEAQQQLIIV